MRLEIAPCLLTRYQRVGRNLAIERELFGWCRHPIQYRERSDQMPALNQRFKSSCDYRVPASGRCARGTVLGGDHVGVLPHSTDFSTVSTAEVVLTSLHSNRPFLSNTLMEHHRYSEKIDENRQLQVMMSSHNRPLGSHYRICWACKHETESTPPANSQFLYSFVLSMTSQSIWTRSTCRRSPCYPRLRG